MGNFIVSENNKSIKMIDCDQMRKSTGEILTGPESWTFRNRHEEIAIKRLPNLITELFRNVSQPSMAKIKKLVVHELQQSGLTQYLR